MQDQYSRTQMLLGAEAMTKLHNSRVAVFGVGGVGGYTVEALARSGVGALDLIDDDKVCLTNLNRQALPGSQQDAPPVPPCSVDRPDRGGVSVMLLGSSFVLNTIHLIHEQTNKAHRQN